MCEVFLMGYCPSHRYFLRCETAHREGTILGVKGNGYHSEERDKFRPKIFKID